MDMAIKAINTGSTTITGNRNISNTGIIKGNCTIAETVINIFPYELLQINKLIDVMKEILQANHSTTLCCMQPNDLQKFLDENVAEIRLQAFLNRFENVLIGVKDVARMHNVNPRTVTNYINDGLIMPEMKVNEKEHPKFRLSYALTLDFRQLQKELRARSK